MAGVGFVDYGDVMSSPIGGEKRGRRPDRATDEIRAAATDIVVAAGDTAALTHDALVERTGLDREVVRLYYADIDTLLHDLLLAAYQRLLERMDLEVSLLEPGATALDELKALAVGYVTWAVEDPCGYALAYGVRNERELGLAGLDDGTSPAAQALDTVIAGVALCRPDLAPDVARELAVGLWLTLHGLIRIRADRPLVVLPPTTHLIHTIVDVFAVVPGPGPGLRLVK